MNLVGVVCAIVSLASWLSAAVLFFASGLDDRMQAFFDLAKGAEWKPDDLQRRVLPFWLCCALGVVALIVGYGFGGWPTG